MDCGASNWVNILQSNNVLRSSNEYARAVEEYLDHAFSTRAEGDQITCPCKECYHRFWYHRVEVYNHLIGNGIDSGIIQWHFDEKGTFGVSSRTTVSDNSRPNMNDDMDNLIYSTHKDIVDKISVEHEGHFDEGSEDDSNAETMKFFKLVEDGKQEVYPGCKSFSKLSFIIRLYLFKCVHGLTNAAFSELLSIIRELIPDVNLPKSFNEARKLVSDLGLHYQKIDACRNDCILFWKDNESATSCTVCNAPRWKEVEKQPENNQNDNSTQQARKIPAKVVWHFPLKPRLQRLYMCSETAEYMRWHDEKRLKDGILRHPADGKSWKDFDSLYPHFSQDSRNVRLGIASDGFNPFRTMNTSHSTWPVVLINYNLPPWLFMKPEYLMLSLLIPGPRSPSNDIDVYLQPLIEELKELWDFGLETYDMSKCQMFQMHVAVQSTTSDFPGYAMLSGWSTKGNYACPYCHYETDHLHLRNSRKLCYMGHRRFLHVNHHWRSDKKSFNGETEERLAPDPLSGIEILELLQDFKNEFGKPKLRKKDDSCPWKKKSCFFDLPYWKYVTSRHHLDAMHIEKNVCDNVLGTLLNIRGKTKDHENARKDLRDMGIRPSLHPVENSDKHNAPLPTACFSMSKEGKTVFCEVLKNAKLPQGCSSNISRCVQMQERKIFGYKSHDAHIIMQYLLQVAVRHTLPKHVAVGLIRLSAFFRGICSRVINPKDLDRLQGEIVEVLCIFERIFPPSFFDIMIHLPIHLVNEVKLSGPVSGWWMYPIERYLGKLKSYVRNRSRPEGSIAEGYLAEECLVFCSRYLQDGVQKRSKNFNQNCEKTATCNNSPIFSKIGYPLGRRKKGSEFCLDSQSSYLAHRYVLFNCQNEEVQKYITEHEDVMSSMSKDKKRKRWKQAKQHCQEFVVWFKERVEAYQVPDCIKWLSIGPSKTARRYTGYYVNGYRFYTRQRDAKCKTQNSGVTLAALTSSFASTKDHNPTLGSVTYYGAINEIIELDYWGCFSTILFRCDWFHVEKDEFGLTRVDFKKLCSVDDPFVLASQARQVFYVKDPIEDSWHYVMKKLPNDFLNIEQQIEDAYLVEPCDDDDDSDGHGGNGVPYVVDDGASEWCREDIPPDEDEAHYNETTEETHIDTQENNVDMDDTDLEWMDGT